jgi:hypothetical protein
VITHPIRKQRRPRTVGVELRGSGPYALLAATVLQAIADLQQEGQVYEEAREWLLSPGCRYCLELLDIPYHPFLEALQVRRLRRGTSTRAFWEDAEESDLELVA